jgi:ferredoxin-NADP reductase
MTSAPGRPAGAPLRWQEVPIARIERRTPRVLGVFLDAEISGHVAGQHIDVRLTAPDGYQAQRSYSIASAPGAAPLELAVEHLEGGEVSAYFHEAAAVGDRIEVRGPIGGHFTWRAADGGPLLLVAGGSGMAPLMSMLRARAAADARVPALLLYSARAWDDVIWRDELLALEARGDGLTVVIATTRGAPGRASDLAGRLDAERLHARLTAWKVVPRHTYVCGANRFVEAMTQALVGVGLPASTIRAERYGGVA